MNINNPQNSLTIRLAESVVFLNAGHHPSSRRPPQVAPEPGPPSMIRGLLVLNLVRPTRISSIEVELQGKTRSGWRAGEYRAPSNC
jgi:arrestin-related trafficking adapter 3/6